MKKHGAPCRGRAVSFRASASVGLAALVFIAACASGRPAPVDLSDKVQSFKASEYDGVREEWTRHGKLVRDIGTVLEVWTLYKSSAFRQAYVEQYASVYGLNREDKAQLTAAQIEAARTTYEFHVVAQSTEWKWNDLEQKDSVWKVSLVDAAGHDIAPSQITFEKLPELYLMKFFPVHTDFSRIYTIRFPREPGGKFAGVESGRLTLRFLGPIGGTETVWEAAKR